MAHKIVYFSLTGQTRKFVEKLPAYEAVEIHPANPFIKMVDPYVLVVPTYDPAVTEPVEDFLSTGNNPGLCLGIMGGGNRNFAQLFGFTAKDLAKAYDLPLLHLFEFQGSDYDVEKLAEGLSMHVETNTY